MPSRAESLFASLVDEQSLRGLIGQSEDADFDCKEWHGEESMRTSLAKAVCGFANAAGGVIVIGMRAKPVGREPDVVQATAPFSNPRSVTSAVLDTILKLVEPGVELVETRVIPCDDDPSSGYLLVYVPMSDGPPHRSRVDWKFYVRIASGTVPMEYFQIEDRFGRRPHARLVPEITSDEVKPNNGYNPTYYIRRIKISVRNTGVGLARYPCLMICKNSGLNPEYLPGGYQTRWPITDSGDDMTSFRGGVNDILYPSESAIVATLVQSQTMRHDANESFSALAFSVDVVCEGTAIVRYPIVLRSVPVRA